MTKKKILSTIISVLLLGTSVYSIFAADVSANLGTSNEIAVVGSMERVSEPVEFDFEVVSVGRDSVTAEFCSSGRIINPPYIGEKGTKNTAEKVSDLQYTLEYDKEYSFVYTVNENGVETVYNSFLTVEHGDDIEIVFGDIIKNLIPNESNRAVRTKTEIESNNVYSSATRTFDDYDNYGALTSNTDVDWWVVTFLNSGTANFWLGNIPANCDYELQLYASNGITLLNYSDNSGNAAEKFTYPVEAGVTYYVKIYSYSGYSTSQYLFRTKWYPYFDSEVYTIRNVGNSMYLTVGQACNASSLSYAYIYTESASEADGENNGQRMRINYDTTGFYTVAPLCSFNGQHRVLDVYGGLSSVEKQLWLFPNNGASEEHFVFELQSDNSYIISFKDNPSYVLDVNSSNDDKVFANTRTGSNSQKWIVTADTTYNAKEDLYNTYNWQWPLASNYYLTSSFGQRTLNKGITYEFHNGIDVSAASQTAIYCPAPATFSHSGLDLKYKCGYFVVVETNDTVYSDTSIKLKVLFQHLYEDAKTTNTSLTNGSNITKGSLVGRVGATGSDKYEPHLHFTVITDGSNVFYKDAYGVEQYSHRSFANTEQPLLFYPGVSFTYNPVIGD